MDMIWNVEGVQKLNPGERVVFASDKFEDPLLLSHSLTQEYLKWPHPGFEQNGDAPFEVRLYVTNMRLIL